MKIVGKNEKECTICGVCETTCSSFYFKEDNREKSAIQIEEKEDGVAEINVCNQCGNCVEVCPVLAITKSKSGVVVINKKTCVGCFNCVGVCPTNTMFWHESVTEPFKCISCARCTKECPTEAIFMEEVQ